MTREEAEKILMAVAVCVSKEMYCSAHCPLYDETVAGPGCPAWTEEKLQEAVAVMRARQAEDAAHE